MPRVHDKYNKYCPQNWIAPFDEANCVCHPTIQHEGHCDGECNHDWCEGKDPEAVCPQEKQDWEAWFDEKFPIAIDYPPFPNKVQETGVFFEIEIEQRTNRAKAKHEAIKDFIRKEKELSKEEGRRENEVYCACGDMLEKDWLGFGGRVCASCEPIERERMVEDGRLAVIAQVEEWVQQNNMTMEGYGYIGHAVPLSDLLKKLHSLKTNSK